MMKQLIFRLPSRLMFLVVGLMLSLGAFGRTRQTLWGAMQMLTQNCCQTIHEEWYVHDSFYLCAEAFDF